MAKDYQVRFAKLSETDQVKRLWQYAFHQDSECFRNWYFSNYYRHKECLVAIGVDGKIYASLQLIAQTLEKNGERYQGAYIVGVDVLPEARDEKLAKLLMLEAESFAKKAGYDFLLLMPFEAGFYYHFGYTFIDFHYKMNLSMSELEKVKKQGEFKPIDLEEKLPLAVREVYQKSQKGYNLALCRTDRHFDSLCKDVLLEGGWAYAYWRDGLCVGYIFYTIAEKFMIRECQYLDEEARQALLHFVRSHASQVSHFQWSAPQNEPLAFHRKVDKTHVALEPFMMVKLICLEKWLKPLCQSEKAFIFGISDGKETIYTRLAEKISRVIVTNKDEVSFVIEQEAFTKMVFGRLPYESISPKWVKNEEDWQFFRNYFNVFNQGMGVYFNEYY